MRPTLEQLRRHEKFLYKHGAHPTQIAKIKKANQLSTWENYNMVVSRPVQIPLSDNVPSNGKRSPTQFMEREAQSRNNFIIGIPYNKGGYTVIPKSELTTMGKKI